MKLSVQLEPTSSEVSEVEYRWDPDTDILSAQLRDGVRGDGLSGSVGLEGADGSWVILEVKQGRIAAVEVAVWPEVQPNARLSPPQALPGSTLLVPAETATSGLAAIEMDTRLAAESDAERRTFHFQLGRPRESRSVQVARDIIIDVDHSSQLAGVWLLNVPPCPPSP